MKLILSRSAASIAAAAALVLGGAAPAQAQKWLGPDNLGVKVNVDIAHTFRWGESHGNPVQLLGQTFAAPAVNPELRQIWALGFQSHPGDVVEIHVAPWDDANQRVSGPPVLNSGPVSFAVGTSLQTTTWRLPEPLMLTPGGRYIIIVRTPFAPGANVESNGLFQSQTHPFPDGFAFRVTHIPPATPLDITTFEWTGETVLDDTDIVQAQFGLQPAFTQPGPQTTVLLHGEKDGTGSPVPGMPGATYRSFGVPSRNAAGQHAFVANARGADGRIVKVFTYPANEYDFQTTRVGDPVPARPGVFFSGFKDPLLLEDGRTVVIATLRGTGITSANNTGIYSYTPDGEWLSVLHTGDEPPGVPGARIRSFRSVAASRGGIGISYQMVTGPNGTAGPGGITSASDTGFAMIDDRGQFNILLENYPFMWGDGQSGIVKSFSALTARPGAPGQGHGVSEGQGYGLMFDGFENDGDVAASVAFQVKFTDGRVGNFLVDDSGAIGSAILTGTTPSWATFPSSIVSLGVPVQSRGGASAFVGKLKTSVNGITSINGTITSHWSSGAVESGALIAREGMVPLGAGGASFSNFLAVVLRHLGDTGSHEVGQWAGFTATLRGPGVNSTNDLCVSRMVGNQFAVVAREGSEAPGVPGSQFRSFSSLGFMDYTDDSCMNALVVVGNMRTGPNGTAGPGGVTKANDQGLWLFDHNGDGHLAFREGMTLAVGGATKTVKSFIVLSSVPYSPAQARSLTAAGQIVLRAIFTDGTCALVLIHE